MVIMLCISGASITTHSFVLTIAHHFACQNELLSTARADAMFFIKHDELLLHKNVINSIPQNPSDVKHRNADILQIFPEFSRFGDIRFTFEGYHYINARQQLDIYLHNKTRTDLRRSRSPPIFGAAITPLHYPALHMARGISFAKNLPNGSGGFLD